MGNIKWNTAIKLRNDISISGVPPIPARYETLFCRATEIISPHVNSKPLIVFFVSNVLHGFLVVQGDHIGEYWRDVIVYNLAKMDTFSDDRWIMVFLLEELVHAYFDTIDEDFVGIKVAELYSEIKFDSTTHKYSLK